MDSLLLIGGINRDMFHPVEVPRDPGVFRVLCSGDPRERKGTDTVQAAFEIVRRRFPDAVLDTYHGQGIPQERMAQKYASADLFVDAQWYAGWNNPVAEAMACGVPVVCTDIGAVGDFAFDGETALLVPVNDADSLARAMIRMIEEDALRARLREAALRRIGRFDWDEAAGRLVGILNERVGA
jgi:glycosyltransferase involved in cell wall biosynthesis